MTGESKRFVVKPHEAGERLDKLVARRAGAIGRRRARELFELGRVTLDVRLAKAAELAPEGSLVTLEPLDDRALPDSSLALDVRLSKGPVVVVHKPAGQPSVPLRPGELGTLANALVARYPEVALVGRRPREPGLVHRLDTQTSGLLVAARTVPAFRHLQRVLAQGELVKRYLAVVAGGSLEGEGVIERPLAPDARRQGRVSAVDPSTEGYARPSLTRYRVLRRTGDFTLVELELGRGFRHQIRAHLTALGAPLVGDTLYGGRAWPEHPERHALHASYVAWAGDRTLAGFEVVAEMPEDMRELVAP